ncbi:hypothetical protein CEE36_01680 [candidate division TA06 bacterium B3_TA06]|uniref:Uncharacterized protein n=1 Tax=candidate division TA06 bacterium B3_TA06 TaxID=2012487 RepID=A0A532V9G5_UNCT6|nr:MAG: hypothetical protein CEE36_01680 [candidate division TA06 bacterium B3_TA06]
MTFPRWTQLVKYPTKVHYVKLSAQVKVGAVQGASTFVAFIDELQELAPHQSGNLVSPFFTIPSEYIPATFSTIAPSATQNKVMYFVSSIMKCNTLESERDFVILRMYALNLPTSWTGGA